MNKKNVISKIVVIFLLLGLLLSCSQEKKTDQPENTEKAALEKAKNFARKIRSKVVNSMPIIGTEEAKDLLRACKKFYLVSYCRQEKHSAIHIWKSPKNALKFYITVGAFSFVIGKGKPTDEHPPCYQTTDNREKYFSLDYSKSNSPEPILFDSSSEMYGYVSSDDEVWARHYYYEYNYLKL